MVQGFKQYVGEYELARWKSLDPRIRFSVLGEVGDQYVVFHHDTGVFGSVLKRHTLFIENFDDRNFRQGWCINVKNVYHHIHNYLTEMESAASLALTHS